MNANGLAKNPLYIAVVAAATGALMHGKTWRKKDIALANEAHKRGALAVESAKAGNGKRVRS